MLLEETLSLTIHGEMDMSYQFEEDSIGIVFDNKVHLTIKSRTHIKQIVDNYENQFLHELLKAGAFQHIKYKRPILTFLDELVKIFTKKQYRMSAFAMELSSIFLHQECHNADGTTSTLTNLVSKFANNNIDASCFTIVYQMFVSKLIISINCNLHKESIDCFMEKYSLV